MAGLGGIFVEIFADVAFRVCPITTRDANDMIRGLRGAALLLGARGGIKAAMGSLIDALVRIGGVGGLLMDLGPKLREVDVNPLIVSGHSAIAVDARILLA
jgi:acetyl-CoA synthetase (ADP-forming)